MKTKGMGFQNINSIKLPDFFSDKQVFVFKDKDFLMIKKTPVADFSYVRKKLKRISRKISQKDIRQAILSARR